MESVDVFSKVFKFRPKELTQPVDSLDRCDHVVQIALAGHPQLAADHLLNREMLGDLVKILGGIIRQLNLKFIKSRLRSTDTEEDRANKVQIRQRAYELLIKVAVNLIGLESKRTGFSDEEVKQALKRIIYTLEKWEKLEKQEDSTFPIGKAVVDNFLTEMRKVMRGKSMVAMMGEEIKKELVEGKWTASFVTAARKVVQSNVYYQMVTKGMCKFGNDYALGLRWLRHLGYVQVSTNPVLAAIAYDDDPELWDTFREVAKKHKEWLRDPEKYGDKIAMQATMVALWPNLTVFRPIALLSNFHDGMVSYQLNPNVASSFEGSIEDALKIYSAAEEFLKGYDAHLTWGYSNMQETGRPNIVFKVAGGYPAAIDITTALNSLGIGTNNTVTYTVAQEVTLIIAAMKGMAEAIKMGIRPTQVYETNMGGRLESHLRDLEAEKLLLEALNKVEDKEGFLRKLAQSLDAMEEIERAAPLEEKVRDICGYRYLKSLVHPAFVDAIASTKTRGETKEENLAFLDRLEKDIGLAGTFVAHRVYWIFFSPENRPKWIRHLQEEFSLSQEEAEEIMDKIDVLPASKRKPADTYLTMANRNITNTEFPNHQYNVLKASQQEEFNLNDYRNAVMRKPDEKVLQRLLKLRDFKKAYELTPELIKKLKEVGVEDDFGDGGLEVEDWPSFGSVVKTMNQFGNGYEAFKERAIEVVRELAEKT